MEIKRDFDDTFG